MHICEHDYVKANGTTDRAAQTAAANLLKALANEHRVGIVAVLENGPRCVHELVDVLGIDQPLVSQHLRILRSARLLETERRGKEVVYSLADHHVAHIVGDAMTHVQETP